ncbi:MAG: carbon starvation protein A [Planctomycetota bacterium]|nr:carbon starvation protein A [Planctomycetota bacterium]
MNAAFLAVLSLGAFFLATRFYARWIERRVYDMDNDDPTPAHTCADGVDFVPCGKHVLFGHHFCSVAGAAPIVGPAIAVIWGWLPALIWIVVGTIFIGAVHDFGALALSAKREGRTMGDLAGDILGPRARIWFLSIIVLLTWVVIAAFGYVIAFLFTAFPASVWPVNFEILVAVIIGWWIYHRGGSLLIASILAVIALYVVVFICAKNPEWGSLAGLGLEGSDSIVAWIVFLLIYSFVASVLPVRVLLQPRDYINSHQLFVGLGGLILGILIVQPELSAPALNPGAAEAGAPPILPLLFITIACGAISGFHSLVASGTTSKQLNKMRDARTVGYGGMVGEGVLAMIAVLAVSAGLGLSESVREAFVQANPGSSPTPSELWAHSYSSWQTVGNTGIGNFVKGGATFLEPLVSWAGDHKLAETIVAVIVISFAATTLDTAARIQRFCLKELGRGVGTKAFDSRYVGAAVAVIPAGLLAIFTDGGRGPGSGGFILWPLFGTTNQLIGGITLTVLFVYLRRAKKPQLPIALPMVFLLVMTTIAGVMNLTNELSKETLNTPVVLFGSLFLVLEALVLYEAFCALRGRGPRPEAA